MNKRILVLFGLLLIMFSLTFILNYYLDSENQRFGRDLYNQLSGSGISDKEVISIWCEVRGFQSPYKELGEKEFCGEVQVKTDCYFTNRGDNCIIEEEKNETNKTN